ncbi:MAG: hypothetical protein L0Z55_12580, partial [Planctomycetes bacterium]|nr:hypothetical protein [Planctomycetota bacterium]
MTVDSSEHLARGRRIIARRAACTLGTRAATWCGVSSLASLLAATIASEVRAAGTGSFAWLPRAIYASAALVALAGGAGAWL